MSAAGGRTEYLSLIFRNGINAALPDRAAEMVVSLSMNKKLRVLILIFIFGCICMVLRTPTTKAPAPDHNLVFIPPEHLSANYTAAALELQSTEAALPIPTTTPDAASSSPNTNPNATKSEGSSQPFSVAEAQAHMISLLTKARDGQAPQMMKCYVEMGDPALEKRYGYLRQKSFKILLGGNTFNTEELLPTQIQSITHLMSFLRSDTIHFGASIHESGSRDKTGKILTDALAPLFRYFGVPDSEIFITTNPVGPDWHRDPDKRIPLLAELRNLVVSHLKTSPVQYDIILFFNDVYYCIDDLLELVHQHFNQQADITCATDWIHKGHFYDTWVARDIEGNSLWTYMKEPIPFNLHPPSKTRFEQRLPVQVYSCWNGMLIFDAAPFRESKVTFRDADPKKGECRESEASRICKDFWIIGKGKVQMLPSISIAYKQKDYHERREINGPEKPIVDSEKIDWKLEKPKRVQCISYQGSRVDWGSDDHSSANLREQTREDLKPFWTGKIDRLAGEDELKHIATTVVLNSSRLKDRTSFEKILEGEVSHEHLHVIFFDEAHWGIDDEGQIMGFFKKVLDIIKELKTENKKPKLFILNVSATAKFYTDTYLGIDGLSYHRDEELLSVRSQTTKSSTVVSQYMKAYRRYEAGRWTVDDPRTIEEKILARLLEKKSKNMVLIRLKSVSDASELHSFFMRRQTPFSVIHYQEESTYKLSNFKKKATLLIVVDRLRMGERLPKNCVAYDVRSRYGPNSNWSTWIQDVGRCAGHNKRPADVYYSHDRDYRTKLHNLLTTRRDPVNQKNAKHPILTLKKLAPYSLILDAEPQIGKTGVMLVDLNATIDLGGEGQCMFLSTACQHPDFQDNIEAGAKRLRRQTMRFLEDTNGRWEGNDGPVDINQFLKGESLEDHINTYSQYDKEWVITSVVSCPQDCSGDHIELAAMAQHFDIKFEIYRQDGMTVVGSGTRVVRLAHKGVHYRAVLPRN
ncbi:hypothetical protein PROFUN_13185 [Planoprotostelium fungivorum]|uniref:OTU domain-containing protein n=1 Tax=Planoprotostelium fungivorum TaxID=1890364 RepID=A0A2P6N501_9EUKA|nr:hypothetical protein PROFUN_13185 [Planoprotostelium fungivorum]